MLQLRVQSDYFVEGQRGRGRKGRMLVGGNFASALVKARMEKIVAFWDLPLGGNAIRIAGIASVVFPDRFSSPSGSCWAIAQHNTIHFVEWFKAFHRLKPGLTEYKYYLTD